MFPIRLNNIAPLPVCAYFFAAQGLAVVALISSSVWTLSFLTVIGCVGLFVTDARRKMLLRYAVIQTISIGGLYCMRYGVESIPSGLLISWKLCLAYTPFIVLSALLSSTSIINAFSKFLTPTMAFTLGCCLRFFPFFFEETKEVYYVQRMRGAHVSLKECWKPVFWRDVLSCLVIPVIAQCFLYAHNLALAVKARGGLRSEKSNVYDEKKNIIT